MKFDVHDIWKAFHRHDVSETDMRYLFTVLGSKGMGKRETESTQDIDS